MSLFHIVHVYHGLIESRALVDILFISVLHFHFVDFAVALYINVKADAVCFVELLYSLLPFGEFYPCNLYAEYAFQDFPADVLECIIVPNIKSSLNTKSFASFIFLVVHIYCLLLLFILLILLFCIQKIGNLPKLL